MLTTVPIEELQSGDMLNSEHIFEGSEVPEEVHNARKLIAAAYAVPTQSNLTEEKARRVIEVRKVGTLYAYVTMGTYAVVSLRKGSLVSVYRNGGNEPQDVSPAVVEHAPECASYLSDDVTGESYVCDCSVGNGVRVTHTVQASTVGNITYPAMVETLPADTEEVPYGPERQPFNYARSQFRQLGNYRETEYPTKLKIQNDNGETHWMNIHPDDLAELQRLMEAREEQNG